MVNKFDWQFIRVVTYLLANHIAVFENYNSKNINELQCIKIIHSVVISLQTDLTKAVRL